MIYLDNAATTRTDPRVLEEMLPYFSEYYGNPSAAYQFSQRIRHKVDACRDQVASCLGVSASEIYFTSGGSESDNWALSSAFEAGKEQGRDQILLSAIEHPAVYNTALALERQGADVQFLPVDKEGVVHPETLEKAVSSRTAIVSVMAANNEIGTLEPIGPLSRIAHEAGALFHTDAVQAFGHIPLLLEGTQVDLLSASGHKFGGPKGVGFLYIKEGLPLMALVHGGSQERNRRAGTENVPGIVGMAKAAQLAMAQMPARAEKERMLRDHLIGRVSALLPQVHLNGSYERRLPGNASLTFPGLSSETALIRLDMEGICASAGSACSTGALEPSRVLTAIGLSAQEASCTLRFSVSAQNTIEEIDHTASILIDMYQKFQHD